MRQYVCSVLPFLFVVIVLLPPLLTSVVSWSQRQQQQPVSERRRRGAVSATGHSSSQSTSPMSERARSRSPSPSRARSLTSIGGRPHWHVVVLGAGAVGGYFASRLAQLPSSTVRLSFLARSATAVALQRDGLRITSALPPGNVVVPPSRFTVEADAATLVKECGGPAHLIIIGCKSHQLRAAAASLRPLIDKDTVVLPLQNGVESSDVLAEILGRGPVLAAFCNVVAALVAPAHIHHKAIEPEIGFGEYFEENKRTTPATPSSSSSSSFSPSSSSSSSPSSSCSSSSSSEPSPHLPFWEEYAREDAGITPTELAERHAARRAHALRASALYDSLRVASVRALLTASGIHCHPASPDVRVSMWRKLVFVASLGVVGAAARCTNIDYVRHPELQQQLSLCMQECVAVARAQGIDLAVDSWRTLLGRVIASAQYNPLGTTSMQRDLLGGLPSELEDQVGAVVRRARATHVATPVYDLLYAILLPQEARAQEREVAASRTAAVTTSAGQTLSSVAPLLQTLLSVPLLTPLPASSIVDIAAYTILPESSTAS